MLQYRVVVCYNIEWWLHGHASHFTRNASHVTRQVLPLYVLGLVRFVTVKAADYQAHTSE